MKTKNLIFLAVLAMGLSFVMTSCEDEPNDPVNPTAPNLQLQTGTGLAQDGEVVDTSSTFTIRVQGTPGTEPMQEVGIYENNIAIDPARLTVNGAPINSNPFLLSAFEAQGFTFDIGIEASAQAETNIYVVEVVDEANRTDFVELSITTEIPGTPVVEMTGLQLFNSAGPVGTGGLNLLTGQSVGSNDPSAQIRDRGIDLSLPVATNWLRSVTGANGTEIRIPAAGLLYDDFLFLEDIVTAYANGAPVTNTDALTDGNLLLLKQGDNYYLLLVTDVVVTPDDNNDYYMFDAKK